MTHIIREKRKLVLSRRVITPVIIRQIAQIFDAERAQRFDNSDKHINTMYSIDAEDNSSYESQSMLVFEPGGMIEKKVITRISMRLSSFDNSKNIELQLAHFLKDDANTNYISISGSDTIWVNGITAKLNEIVHQSQKQFNAGPFIDYGCIAIGVLFNVVYFRIFYSSIEAIRGDFLKLALILGVPVISMYGLISLSEFLKGFWPSVELQTGPGHFQIPMMKRKKLSWILTAIIIPLLLGGIYDVLKNLLHIF